MPNFSKWLGSEQAGATFSATRIIKRDAVDVVFSRGASDLAAQTCRVVPAGSSAGSPQQTDANNAYSQADVVVIGEADLNVQKGDFFTFRSERYKVFYVNMAIPGQVQAFAKGTQ